MEELIQKIKDLYISGVPDEDFFELTWLHQILMDVGQCTVVKIEAYKKICESNWEELPENIEAAMEDYRNYLLDIFSEPR
jgi:hypothetical protein